MRRVENLENICKGNKGSVFKINVLILLISAPERGPTPHNLQGSDVTKDRGFLKTKTDEGKYAFIKGKNGVAAQYSRSW